MVSSYIATLCALATIMASLTGFFSQQLILFRDCAQLDNTLPVSVAKTNNFSLTGESIQNMVRDVHPAILAAINVGIIQPVGDLTSVLSQGCTSGNCTFPETDGASFQTLAMGYSCKDVTAVTNSTMPSGVALQTFTVDADFLALAIRFRPSVMELGNFKAVGCELFPTVNTYAVNITKGQMKERLVDQIPVSLLRYKEPHKASGRYQDQSSFWYTHSMSTNYTLRNGIRESCEGSEKPQPGYRLFFKTANDSVISDPEHNTTERLGWQWWYYPPDCVWTMNRLTTYSIIYAWDTLFDGQTLNQSRRGGMFGSVLLRRLFSGGNMTLQSVEDIMSNLTTSMTAAIRSQENGEKSPWTLQGDMWVTTTCMYIRWPWITFPAATIGLTGLFLLLVAIDNRGTESERLWKSSILATLFCEVEHEDGESPRPDNKQAMKEAARSKNVSLNDRAGYLKLVSR